MAELTISPEEITEALKRHVESFRPEVMREEVGRVTTAGDGIARVPTPISVSAARNRGSERSSAAICGSSSATRPIASPAERRNSSARCTVASTGPAIYAAPPFADAESSSMYWSTSFR